MEIQKRSAEQLAAARQIAVATRRERAEARAKLKKGEISLGQVLVGAERDKALAYMRVFDLLTALPRVGERRATKVMEALSIASNRRIRGLGRLQIAGLKAEFGER